MPNSTCESTINHYEVLGLAQRSPDQVSKDTIKAAYRTALLQHHPDKRAAVQHYENSRPSISSLRSGPEKPPTFSIDQISLAYKILVDPIARADYDRKLQLSATAKDSLIRDFAVNSGIDIFDLEELTYDKSTSSWHKPCRCGKGYLVSEEQLEREASHGEIYISCEGCSLWIQVLFEVEEPPDG